MTSENTTRLGSGLKVRHLTMMGLGSTIGAGLFLGTGVGIKAAGPSVIVAYIIAGFIAVMIMRMLGEMGSVVPASGSFSEYADAGIGHWAGFIQGWVYWLATVAVLGAEITGAAGFVASWLGISPWIPALFFVVIFGTVNLLRVRAFGEFEFWFAFIKVAVLILFLFVGFLLVTGLLPGHSFVGLKQIESEGFMPNGLSGIAAALLAVAFGFGGIEVVAIASAESEDPQRSLVNAVRTTITRISIFYLGSVAVIVLLLPYSSLGKAHSPAESPFSQVLAIAGIPGVVGTMEVVIVLALLSAFNAQIYASSRMMMSLAERRQAPRAFARVNKQGVPTTAILLSVVLSIVMVLLNYLDTGWLLSFLLNAAGASLLTVWTFVAVSQLKLRRRLEALSPSLGVRMWAYPWLTSFTLVVLAGLAALMLSDAHARVELLSALTMVAILFLASLVAVRRPFEKAQLPGENSTAIGSD
ncbi:Aromatic amino acid transport protein [Corynebacterium pseudotuberculosis]|uniref:amino acid permease n=1 Tax=Corynebacterium pseudotuberculosis TaxID=1719 RepID=UPI0001DD469B|nr:amino acid permease [Corynebacterium pseudotuberculosis]ADL20665.1 amino acid permease [Corynebacterium pseudotuberculosis 1002]AJC13509.1 Aromatic amino acid transport protein [Corynebacterium pseudotuberculosis]AKJ55450.1 Aromatic amino acid transport protein [Corynebacterium pseudotuberculosis]ALM78416.1 Aromatic amino acid transport protein [Corynebacterium pseudotuberculosis]ANK56157.1 aromatic amino acid transport protein [Corynebacterium pseudotuberculosis]